MHVQVLADVKIEGYVPATVFLPRPKVASALVSISRRTRPAVDVPDVAGFIRFVRDAFGHRRKTLRNSLVAGGRDGAAIERALVAAGVDPRARPEQVDMHKLAEVFAKASR